MEFKDNFIQGFTLTYRSLEDDADRYLDDLVELLDEGKIEKVEGKSLIRSHFQDARIKEWMINSYFEKGRLDQLEDHCAESSVMFFAPIDEDCHQIISGFAKLGEKERLLRVYRTHISWMRSRYWGWLSGNGSCTARDTDKETILMGPLDADEDAWQAHVLEMKTTFLDVLSVYRNAFRQAGASDEELLHLEYEIQAVCSGYRVTFIDANDRRSMTENVFWEIIGTGLGAQSLNERLEAIPDRLALFQDTAIREFDRLLWQMNALAYRKDIWAIAYLLNGGCSDDAFDEFRGWLIMQGEVAFQNTLHDPDRFDVSTYTNQTDCMSLLRGVAPMAHLARTGKIMASSNHPPVELHCDDWQEEEFPVRLPTIAKTVGWPG